MNQSEGNHLSSEDTMNEQEKSNEMSAGDGATNTKSEQETLYLIYKYLNSIPACKDASQRLKEDLQKNSLLGKVYAWNGASKKANIKDMNFKYSHLPNDALVSLLRHATQNAEESPRNTSVISSLRAFNFPSTSDVVEFKKLVSHLTTILSKQCNIRCNIARNERKMYHLSHSLERPTDFDNYASESSSISECNNPLKVCEVGSQPHSTPSAQTETSTLHVMRIEGIKREMEHLNKSVSSMKDTNADLNSSRVNIEKSLSSSRFINTAITRECHGVCDNIVDKLKHISLGKSNYGTRHNLGNPWVENERVQSRMRLRLDVQYQKLWTSSGHLLHPAYTAIIDRSCRFAITGSDDYLVKIWDINTGQLVQTCRGHQGPIVNIVISADNALMATACVEGSVRLWRLRDGRCLRIWHHGSQINCLAFDSLTCALVYGGEDGNCMVWDLCSLLFDDNDQYDSDNMNIEIGADNQNITLNGVPPPEDHRSAQGMSMAQPSDTICSGKYPLLECAIEAMNERIRSKCLDIACNLKVSVEESYSSCSSSRLLHRGDRTQIYSAETEKSIKRERLSDTQESVLKSNCELFSWNMPVLHEEDSSSSLMCDASPVRSLCLPHIDADLKGEKISVEAMDICSVSNLLVTGGSDGIARVWRLNEPSTAINNHLRKLVESDSWVDGCAEDEGIHSAKRKEKERKDVHIARSLNPSICNDEMIKKLETVAYRQLCRLEGHVSAVTDVQFSHAGDRILTGSWKKDGTVRIWTFSKDFLKQSHLVLSINENDVEFISEQPAGDQLKRGPKRHSSRCRNNKPQIHNVFWSCDDSTILVVHSFVPEEPIQEDYSEFCSKKKEGTRLRVYDSWTGKLLKIITISFQKCHVLACHPTNPHLAFTAGQDGTMCVWNVNTVECISQHRNLCPEGGLVIDNTFVKENSPLEIVDGKFSADGLSIAATDITGRLIILGNDNPLLYKNVHDSQYFLSDYSNVIHDRNGWPIDADSQLPLHLAPVGPLCRTDCTPYADQPTQFPLPQPFSKNVTMAALKEAIHWSDRYAATVSRAYVSQKKYMMRVGDTSRRDVPLYSLPPSMNKPKKAMVTSPPRRSNPHAQSRRMTHREFIEIESDDDSDDSDDYVDCNDNEMDSDDDGSSDGYEEEFGMTTRRSKTLKNADARRSTRSSSRFRKVQATNSVARQTRRLSSNIASASVHLIANCTECGQIGEYNRSAPHTLDEPSGTAAVCGKYTVNPREGLPCHFKGIVANCSGCGQLGKFKKYVPPSGNEFYKPHVVKDSRVRDGEELEVGYSRCGVFIINPRHADFVDESEWRRSQECTVQYIPLSNNNDVLTSFEATLSDSELKERVKCESDNFEEIVRNALNTETVSKDMNEFNSSSEGEDDFSDESSSESNVSPSRLSKRWVTPSVARKPRTSVSTSSSRNAKKSTNVIAPWSRHNGHRTVPLWAEVDTDWLQAVETVDHQYVPQIGDKVVYFPQGHSDHLQAVPEARSPPWFTYRRHLAAFLSLSACQFQGRWPCVECKVLDIQYDFPKSSDYKKCRSGLAEIELELVGIPKLSKVHTSTQSNIHSKFAPLPPESQNVSFFVTLRNLDLPDFLVPMHLYQLSSMVSWKRGTKFQTFFREDVPGQDKQDWNPYSGVVVRSTNFDEEWPRSPWNSLEVIWEESLRRIINENLIERINPWDAKVSDEECFIRPPSSNSSCKRPALRRCVITELIKRINEKMEMEKFDPFSFPIDSEAFADYYCIIPCAMYLDLIRSRLEKNYYRQVEALKHDISLIARNCELYNEDGTAIIADAQQLVQELNDAVDEVTALGADGADDDNFNEGEEDDDDNDDDDGGGGSQGVAETPRNRRTPSSLTSGPATAPSAERNIASEELRLRFRRDASRQRSSPTVQNTEDGASQPLTRAGSRRAESQSGTSPSDTIRLRRSKRKRDSESSASSSDASEEDTDASSQRYSTRRSTRKTLRASPRRESRAKRPQRRSRSTLKVKEVNDSSEENEEDDEDGEDDQCTTRSSPRRGLRVSSSRASRSGPSKELSTAMEDIVQFCESLDSDFQYFTYPVDDDIAPGYSSVVSKPMCYSVIRKNISEAKYRSIQQLANDIMLIFDNCQKYNIEDSEVFRESKKQRREAKKMLQNYGL